MKKLIVLLFAILVAAFHVKANVETAIEKSHNEVTDTTRFTLSVVIRGNGTGTVNSSPAGIYSPSVSMAIFDEKTNVALHAIPKIGSRFKGWMGASGSSSPSINIVMISHHSIVAVFEEIDDDLDGVGVLTDCDDKDPSIFQSATIYVNADGDGYDGGQINLCYGSVLPKGYAFASSGKDCDDKDPAVFQSATIYVDADGDGYDGGQIKLCYGSVLPKGYALTSSGKDCDDKKANINPTTQWYLDKDADGFAVSVVRSCESPGVGYTTTPLSVDDCNDKDPAVHKPKSYYIDSDHDGYGSGPAVSLCSNLVPPNYSVVDGDCDDTNPAVHNKIIYYRDSDNDGFGNSVNAVTLCSENAPSGFVRNNVDCDDSKLLYADNDGDGYGAGSPVSCGVEKKGDCNDANSAIHPGASDVCNGIDDNCNATVDEHCQITQAPNADSLVNLSGNTIIVRYGQIKINILSAQNLNIVVNQTPINRVIIKDTTSKYTVSGKLNDPTNSLLLTIGIPNQYGKTSVNEQFTIQLIPSSNNNFLKQKK